MDSDDSKSLMCYYILRFNACIVNQNIFLLEKCHCSKRGPNILDVQTIISRMMLLRLSCVLIPQAAVSQWCCIHLLRATCTQRGVRPIWSGTGMGFRLKWTCKKTKGLLFSTRFSVQVTILIWVFAICYWTLASILFWLTQNYKVHEFTIFKLNPRILNIMSTWKQKLYLRAVRLCTVFHVRVSFTLDWGLAGQNGREGRGWLKTKFSCGRHINGWLLNWTQHETA